VRTFFSLAFGQILDKARVSFNNSPADRFD
jgi:hypothetical protein